MPSSSPSDKRSMMPSEECHLQILLPSRLRILVGAQATHHGTEDGIHDGSLGSDGIEESKVDGSLDSDGPADGTDDGSLDIKHGIDDGLLTFAGTEPGLVHGSLDLVTLADGHLYTSLHTDATDHGHTSFLWN